LILPFKNPTVTAVRHSRLSIVESEVGEVRWNLRRQLDSRLAQVLTAELRMNGTLKTIILILIILLLLGSLPAWPYSAGWGYYPSGGLGLVLVILIILLVAGKL
jgi:polyferredoxin